MSDSLPVPADDAHAIATRDVSAAIAAVKGLLAAPVFERNLPVALLTKMAADPNVPAREQRRCMETLAHLQLDAARLLGDLTGARDQRLKDLGIQAGPQEVHVEQHNTRIEIVREGQRDWRTAEGG